MELKVIVLSLACVSLLMPPALGTLALAKTAALNAVKGASLIGAGLALKGKAALLAGQGLAHLALRGAALKARLANAAAQNAYFGGMRGMMLQRPFYYPALPLNTMVVPGPGPNLFDILSGVWRAIRNKVAIAGQVLGNMNCPPVVGYLSRPNLYPLPMMGCMNQLKKK